MKEFSSIGQYRNVVSNVRRYCETVAMIPLPTAVEFVGTPKLHGTNAGVRLLEGYEIQPQSRNRELSIGSDNAGFAAFSLSRKDYFLSMGEHFSKILDVKSSDLTIFGEWCGGNIQAKVGLNTVPKHFVIFNVYNHVTDSYNKSVIETISEEWLKILNEQGIYLITQVPKYSLVVDFTQPEQVLERITELTLQVEEDCPWTRFMGGQGIGEGIVWEAKERPFDTNMWFKSKGEKHAKGGDRSKVNVATVDPIRATELRELIAELVPITRLEQGITELKQQGIEIEPKNTGAYLQWISKDVLKEHQDTLLANSDKFDWKKDVSGQVVATARQYWLKAIHENLNG